MVFTNIDSLLPPDAVLVERVCAEDGHSLSALARTPVFWVGEPLIDKLYDPWRCRLLNTDCVDLALAEKEGRRLEGESLARDIELFWSTLAECSARAEVVYRPATGVFIQHLDSAALKAVAAARKKAALPALALSEGDSAVFVCPERCARRVSGIADTTLTRAQAIECSASQVVFHELHHAWFRTDQARYATPWGRLFEESLCEHDSLLPFKDRAERALLNRALAESPLEYRARRYWRSARGRRFFIGWDEPDENVEFLWRSYDYRRLFNDSSMTDSTHQADVLFGSNYGAFVKANASRTRADLLDLFWMQAARKILEWMRAEVA